MVSLRFPFFSFSQSPNSNASSRSRPFTAVAFAGDAAAVATGMAISENPTNPFSQNALNLLLTKLAPKNSNPLWGSLSLSDSRPDFTESASGVSFPATVKDSQQLLGVGLRKKSVMGLKNINVYAFGVYVDETDVKKFLSEKYGTLSDAHFKEKKVNGDIMDSDICMTIRLQIVYGRLSIRSVRNAFEESVGNRLKKFGGSDNKELLETFTSQFKDEIKIPRGSTIDLLRECGYVLRTTINGNDVGSIQSKLLCRSILDLYIGDDPFDKQAKDNVHSNLASLLKD